MADRSSDFTVRIGGDGAPVLEAIDKIRTSVTQAVKDLERQTKNVELFKDTRARVDEATASLSKLTAEAQKFRDEAVKIESSGGKVGKDLAANLKAAEQQVARATKELDRQTATLAKLEGQLGKAGVDTKRLADEEVRLAAATKEATKQQELLNARQALGVKSAKDVADQIAKLNAAYATLKQAGAPVKELAEAQRNLGARIAELQAPTGGLTSAFTSLRGSFLGVAGALTGVVAALKAASDAAFDHERRVAQIGAIANLTAEQLGALGDEVTQVASELGVNLQQALQATYDLLRQGIPAGSIVEFLKTADAIADTGLADFNQAIKLSSQLVRGFGVTLDEMPGILDQLANTAKNGGATFGEFADNLGDIAPLARATKTSLAEIAAAVEQMIQAGLDAPTAFNTVQQVLARLANPEVAEKLRGLGVQVNGLADTFDQLRKRGVPVGEIVEMGVVSARAAPGVAALTNNTGGLADAAARMRGAAGEFRSLSDAAGNVRSKAIESLVTSLEALLVALGKLVAPSAEVIKALSSIVQLVTAISVKVKELNEGSTGQIAKFFTSIASLTNPFTTLRVLIGVAGDGADRLRKSLGQTAEAAKAAGTAVEQSATQIGGSAREQTEAAEKSFAELTKRLQVLVPTLQAASKALASLGADAIAEVNQRADAQIAALDKLTLSESEHARQVVAIQLDAAAQRLTIIQQTGRDAVAAFEVEAETRRTLARSNADELKKVELEIAQGKREILKTIVGAYDAHLKQLLQLEQSHLAKIAALNQKRIDVNADIDSRIRNLVRANLTAYQQYQDKIKEIDENIAKARDELIKGNGAAAEKYAQKAIELVNGIAGEVKDGNTVVVDSLTAQKTAVEKLEKARDVLNDTITESETAAKKEAKTAQEARIETERYLAAVKQELADINAVVAAGINVAVTIDAKTAVDAARAEILSLDGMTVTAKLRLEKETVETHAVGGLVGQTMRGLRSASRAMSGAVQRFADGGSVFRRPAWNKVPGTGSGDTVPAALQAGSFVVRKAASRFYGDGLMAALARGFATGGTVSPLLGGPGAHSKLTGKAGGLLGNLGNGGELFDLISAAFRVFQPLIDKAKTLPRSTTGQNLADYLAAVLDLIRNADDIQAAATLLDGVASISGNLMASIDTAHKFNVPIVMGAFAPNEEEGVFKNTPASALYDALVKVARDTYRGDGRQFATGGFASGTDTVPAMLTPGEFVVRKAAVDRFGTGLLHAVNSMRISREALARFVAPPQRPRYFAEGGMVSAGTTTAPAAPAPIASSSNIDVQVHASASTIMSRENVQRILIPQLKEAMRRGALKL